MSIVMLPNVRLSYNDIWLPGKPQNPGDAPKYGAQFILSAGSPAEALAKEALIAAAKEVFGANWQAIVGAMEKSKKCVRRGDDQLDGDGNIRNGYAGNLYVVARNKAKPAIVGAIAKNKDGSWNYLTEADGKPYSGCIVNAKIDIQAMKAKDKIPNQIYAKLLAIQFVRDGEAFGASPGTAEGFDNVDGAEDESAPSGADGLF